MDKVITVMQRYELKYILTKTQLEHFKTKILEHMKMDKYGLTSIASLYYDTPNYTLINRSIEKPLYKEKLRLRSYGLADKNSPVFLEIKRKNDKIVYKRRITTSIDNVNKFMKNDEKLSKTQIEKELQAFKDKYKVLVPKYLIIYDRISYYQDDSDLRITIDMNPRYRVNNLNLYTSMEGTRLLKEGEAILEIKVQNTIPLWLVEILTKEKIYQTSFSKVGAAHIKEMSKLNKGVMVNKPRPLSLEGGYQYGFTI